MAGTIARVRSLLITLWVAAVLAAVTVRVAIGLAHRGFFTNEMQRLLEARWGMWLVFLTAALAVWCAFLFVRGVGAALAFLGTGKAARGVLVLDEPLAVSRLSDAELLVGAVARIVRPLWLPLGLTSLLLWYAYFVVTIASSGTPVRVVVLAAAVALPCCLAASYLACCIWAVLYVGLGRGHGAWAFALGPAVLTMALTAGFIVESRALCDTGWLWNPDWIVRLVASEVLTGVGFAWVIVVAALVLLLEFSSRWWHVRSVIALAVAACLPGVILVACAIPGKVLEWTLELALHTGGVVLHSDGVWLVMDVAAAVFVGLATLLAVALLTKHWLLVKVAAAAALLVFGMTIGDALGSLDNTWFSGIPGTVLLPVGALAIVNPIAGPGSQWPEPPGWTEWLMMPSPKGGYMFLDWLRGPAIILMQIGLLLVLAPYALAAVRAARAGLGAGSGRGGS